MSNNDWTVRVGLDPAQALQKLRELSQAGKRVGQDIGKGLDPGFQRVPAQASQATQAINTVGQAARRVGQDAQAGAQGVEDLGQAAKKAGQEARQGAAGIAQVGKEAKDASGPVSRLGSGLAELVGSFAAFVSAGAAAAFVFNELKKLDAAAAAVRTLGVNSEQLSNNLRTLSIATGGSVSQVQLLTAAYDVASSGFADAASATKILEAATLGARGGFADLNTVADATTSVLNAYGLSADRAAKLVDGFIQTQNDGKIVVAQYAAEIGNVSSIAAAAGISIEELNAAIATATAKGVPVPQAFTGIRQAISSILNPTGEAKRLAGELGLAFGAQALKTKGLGGFLEELNNKTKGNVALNVQLLSSIEAVAAIQPLLNDGLATYNRNLGNQNDAAGEAQKAFDTVGSTISESLNKIGNGFSNLATSLDKSLSPVLSGLLEQLAQLLNGLAQAQSLTPERVQQLNQQADRIVEGQTGALQRVSPLGSQVEFKLNGKTYKGSVSDVRTAVFRDLLAAEAKKAAEALTKSTGSGEAGPTGTARVKVEGDNSGILRAVSEAQVRLDQLRLQQPIKLFDEQLATAGAVVSFVKTAVDLESSRFDILKARNEFDLQRFRNLGFSEQQLAGLRQQNERIEARQIEARFEALLRTQQIEAITLGIQQQKARIAAQIDLVEQRRQERLASQALRTAQAGNDPAEIASAQAALDERRELVRLSQANLSLLERTQPIEALIATASAEQARNGLLAQAARQGLEGNLLRIQQTLQSVNVDLNTITANDLGELFGNGASQADRLARSLGSTAQRARQLVGELEQGVVFDIRPGRFTGGPVTPGQDYTVNEFGQEAFLSRSGQLSLINKPAWSAWRPPTAGTVIPAGVTADLKARGALSPGGGRSTDPAIAQLSAAVGNLSREVAQLRAKKWVVPISVRNQAGTSQITAMNRLL